MDKDNVDRSNEFDLLNSDEWDCYSRLSEAWNVFIELPELFPGDRQEFARYVNILKLMLMARPVMREMVKQDWPGYVKPETEPEVKKESPDYQVHPIDCVECYTSNSGNRTWKAFDQDGTIIYLRQSGKKDLAEAGIWDKLQAIAIGETWDVADAQIHTIEDGDFRKPVQFDGDWEFQKPTPKEPATPEHESAAIRAAQSWMQTDFVVLDTETTGLEDAYPVEVTVIDKDGNELFNQRVKLPDGIEIEPEATKVHGISLDDLKNCPEWSAVYPEFVAAVKDKTVLIYNADFDTAVIERASQWYKLDIEPYFPVCVMKTYARYVGNYDHRKKDYRWVGLGEAVKREGLPVDEAHTALGDCRMTLALAKALAGKAIVESKSSDIPF